MNSGQSRAARRELARRELSRRGVSFDKYLEPALMIGSAIVAEPVSGIAGIVQSLNPFADEGAGARAVQDVQQAMTYQPRTQQGQAGMQAIGDSIVGEFGEIIQGAEDTLGSKTLEYTGSPLLATMAHSAPTALLEAIGVKSFGKAGREAAKANRGTVNMGAPIDTRKAAVKELEKRGALDMSQSARMQRAIEQEYTIDAYHGSTHDIDEFGRGNYETGGHFGGGDYFSTSADDASRHYAGEGPDLTNRIQLRAEQIANDLDLDYDDPTALAQARKELKGANEGVLYPVKLKMGKNYNVDEGTNLSYEREVPDYKDYLDEAGGDVDEARDLAYEASWDNEPTGELADFMDSIRDQAQEHGFDADEVLQRIDEYAAGGGINAKQLDEIMRKTEWYAEDVNTGDLINNEVYRKALEDAGFDSITHDGNIFSGMDIEPGTQHHIMLNPANIRGKSAAFDPANIGKNKLLGSADPKILPATGAAALVAEKLLREEED